MTARELVEEGVSYLSFSSDVNMLVDQAAQAAESIRTGTRAMDTSA